MSRDFIQVVGAAAALAAVIIAGMALVMSTTVAPVRGDMRLLHEDIHFLRTDMQRGFEAVDSEFRAVRSGIADLRVRLTRVETLLERDTDQHGASVKGP